MPSLPPPATSRAMHAPPPRALRTRTGRAASARRSARVAAEPAGRAGSPTRARPPPTPLRAPSPTGVGRAEAAPATRRAKTGCAGEWARLTGGRPFTCARRPSQPCPQPPFPHARRRRRRHPRGRRHGQPASAPHGDRGAGHWCGREEGGLLRRLGVAEGGGGGSAAADGRLALAARRGTRRVPPAGPRPPRAMS